MTPLLVAVASGPPPGILVDLDGDGALDVVTCAADGLSLGAARTSTLPCRAVVADRSTVLAAIGDEVRRWDLPGPIDGGIVATGPPTLALPGHRLPPGFPGVGAAAHADVDGDGAPEWVVTHPDARLVGVIGADGPERAVPVPVAPLVLAVGDVDGDGVPEVVVGDGERVATLRAPKRPPPPAPAAADLPHQWLLGARILPVSGTGPTLASGRTPARTVFTGSLGVGLGSSLAPGRGFGGFLAAAAAWEYGRGHARTWWGLDTNPLLLQAGDTVVWHALYVSAGGSFGAPHLRTGPYLTAGLLGAGVGWRTLALATERRSGALHGLEGRLALLAGPDVTTDEAADAPTGEVMLLWASTLPLGRKRGRWDPAPALVPTELREGPLVCRRLAASVGAAAGGSSTRLSWDHIGDPAGVAWSGSPAVSLACETGSRGAGLVLAGDAAPLFTYRVPWDDERADQLARHMGSATVGAAWGGDGARVGPIATAGIWTLGAGLRAAITPWATGKGVRHGAELRAVLLLPSGPSAMAFAGFTTWVDPRRGRVPDER